MAGCCLVMLCYKAAPLKSYLTKHPQPLISGERGLLQETKPWWVLFYLFVSKNGKIDLKNSIWFWPVCLCSVRIVKDVVCDKKQTQPVTSALFLCRQETGCILSWEMIKPCHSVVELGNSMTTYRLCRICHFTWWNIIFYTYFKMCMKQNIECTKY